MHLGTTLAAPSTRSIVPTRGGGRSVALAVALLVGCGTSAPRSPPPSADGGVSVDITIRLRMVPGLTVRELESPGSGLRHFLLTLEQPADFARPEGSRFTRRMLLLYRGDGVPTVLYHTGYMLFGSARFRETALLVGGNQLTVEHRFFGGSSPAPPDYSLLTIRQAAEDDHHLIVALKAVFPGKWLTSGASKGGMTALFHKRFYPNDVDGTVAYVAPINVAADLVPNADNRFVRFFQNVGTADCRQRLTALQREVLTRREELVPMMEAFARSEDSATYTNILGAERAFEFAAGELPFFFWQYGEPADCASLPAPGATLADLFAFFSVNGHVLEFTDQDLTAFLAYYHHSATELGWASLDEAPIADLLRFPMQDRPRAYVPAGVPVADYQPAVMDDIVRWASTEAARVILVYGANDPWTAAALDLGPSALARDSFRFFAPGQNHGAGILALAPTERDAAIAALTRWAGVTTQRPTDTAKRRGVDTPDALRDRRGRTLADVRARVRRFLNATR